MKHAVSRIAAVAFGALALAGCVDSSGPILSDATPVFGETIRIQYYTLRGGGSSNGGQAVFRWNGALYAHQSGGMREVSAFSIHPFEAGDAIIQSVPSGRARASEFAIMRKLAEGVYHVAPVDQADADEPTRVAYCHKVDKSSCRIETRAALYAFARATSARQKQDGGLVIRVGGASPAPAPEKKSPPPRRRHR